MTDVDDEPSDSEMQCDDNFDIEYGDDYISADDEEIIDDEAIVIDNSIAQLKGHNKDVFCLTLSNSKRWLASGAEDDTACIWDLDNLNLIEPYLRITDHSDSVIAISFNASSTLLATADMSGRIICTDVEQKIELYKIEDCNEVEWILWHSSADILFSGTTEGLIWMWLLSKTGVSQSKIYSRGDSSSCLRGQLLPDSKHLLVVYSDGDVRNWDLKSATSSSVQLSSAGYSIDVHPTQPLVAIGCNDGTTVLLNTTTMKVISTYGRKNEKANSEAEEIGNENIVEVVRFSPQFSWLSTGTTNGALTIYDIESGTLRHACEHDGHTVVSSLWRKDLKTDTLQIISICMDGGVRIWDAKSGEPIQAFSCGDEGVFDFCLVERNDIAQLFVACSAGVIRVFDC